MSSPAKVKSTKEEEKGESSVRYPLLLKCLDQANAKRDKQQALRLQDFHHLLPKTVARDKTLVAAIHGQAEKAIGEDIQGYFAERFEDWDLEDRLRELDRVAAKHKVNSKAW